MEQNEVQGIKISQLDELTSIQDDDVLASVDTSEIKTTKVKASTLKSYINKEVNEDISDIKENYALKTSIPTKLSQLNNDSGFIDKSVNNLDNYYKKTEIDTKVQGINTTTNELDTRLTTAEKNIETNTTDIKDLSNRTKRIETDIFDSGEASGTGINLQDSTLAEFQEVKVDGVGNQVTTTGKNLYNSIPTNVNGMTTILEEDGTLVINGTAQISYANVTKTFNTSLEIGTYTFSIDHIIDVDVRFKVIFDDESVTDYEIKRGSLYVTKTTSKNIKGLYVFIYGLETGQQINNLKLKIQVEVGAKATEFEKYTGGEPSPSPDYEQPIEVIEDDFDLVSCGNNLISLQPYTISSNGITTNFDGEKFKINGTATLNWAYISNQFEIFLEPGKYTISKYKETQFQLILNLYNENKVVKTIYIGIPTLNNTFEIESSITKARLSFDNITSGDVVNEELQIQLEKNSTATSFETYIETRQTITMPEDEFAGKIDDTYKDQFRINYNEEDGKYHLYLDKVVGKVVLDGSDDENYVVQQATTNTNMAYAYTSIIDKLALSKIGKSNIFCLTNDLQINTDKDESFAISVSISFKLRFFIKKNRLSEISRAGFRSYLNTNNVEIYYALAEPYTLDLGVVNMPLSYYPITNVYNTCEAIPNMYVKYYRDFKKTITTMQVDIENLKEAVSTLTSNQTSMDNDISTLQNVVSSSLNEETESEVVTE